jgi:hypothetical protein
MASQLTYVKSLYAISDGIGNVKFGVAKNPFARIREMQTGNAHPLQLLFEIESTAKHPRSAATGAYWLEHEVHDLLASKRMTGEWFAVDYHYAHAAMVQVHQWAGESRWLAERGVSASDVLVHTPEHLHVWYWPTSDVYERGLVE